MTLALPRQTPQYSPQDQADLRGALIRADAENIKKGDDIDSRGGRVFLYSPNGQRWQIVVSNAGVLSVVSA